MPRKTGTGLGVRGPMHCACCTRASIEVTTVCERLEKFHFVAFVLFIYIPQNKYAAARWILLPLLCRVHNRMRIYCMVLLLRWKFSEVLLCGLSVYCVYFQNVIISENGSVSGLGLNIYSACWRSKKMLKKLRIFT